MDNHLYRCFTPADHKLTGEQHAEVTRKETKGHYGWLSGRASGNMIVGEWSAGLNPASLGGGPAGEQDRQRRVFVRAQIECYDETCAGWFWWTYKKTGGWDCGWCARDAMTAEILPKWVGKHRDAQRRPLTEEAMHGPLQNASSESLCVAQLSWV